MYRIKLIIFNVIESLIRSISGGLGRRIRYCYYSRRFRKCGGGVFIDEGVVFRNPEKISVGDNVWFNSYSIITAKAERERFGERKLIRKSNPAFDFEVGELIIGSNTGIGSFCVLQGYGGIVIEENCAISDYVRILSFSHFPCDPDDPTAITYASGMNTGGKIVCIESPVVIKNGSWVAMGCTVLGGTIGANSFVALNSVATGEFPENSYIKGFPAVRIKDRFQNYKN